MKQFTQFLGTPYSRQIHDPKTAEDTRRDEHNYPLGVPLALTKKNAITERFNFPTALLMTFPINADIATLW